MCEEQKCQDEVFSLAVNYMDRFLMCCSIMKNQLQLLGTVCMLLASKLRESKPLAGETLVYYTDHSVTKQLLWVSKSYLTIAWFREWEMISKKLISFKMKLIKNKRIYGILNVKIFFVIINYQATSM